MILSEARQKKTQKKRNSGNVLPQSFAQEGTPVPETLARMRVLHLNLQDDLAGTCALLAVKPAVIQERERVIEQEIKACIQTENVRSPQPSEGAEQDSIHAPRSRTENQKINDVGRESWKKIRRRFRLRRKRRWPLRLTRRRRLRRRGRLHRRLLKFLLWLAH